MLLSIGSTTAKEQGRHDLKLSLFRTTHITTRPMIKFPICLRRQDDGGDDNGRKVWHVFLLGDTTK
jgi:hypothetical protein